MTDITQAEVNQLRQLLANLATIASLPTIAPGDLPSATVEVQFGGDSFEAAIADITKQLATDVELNFLPASPIEDYAAATTYDKDNGPRLARFTNTGSTVTTSGVEPGQSATMLYYAATPASGVSPDDGGSWTVFAADGEQGPAGANAPNPNYTITVRSEPNLNPDLTVNLTGTYPTQTIEFPVVAGPAGNNGIDGTNAQDPNYTITVRSEPNLNPDLTVNLTGTYPTQTIEFPVVAGPPGVDGIATGVKTTYTTATVDAAGEIGGTTTLSVHQNDRDGNPIQGLTGLRSGSLLAVFDESNAANYTSWQISNDLTLSGSVFTATASRVNGGAIADGAAVRLTISPVGANGADGVATGHQQSWVTTAPANDGEIRLNAGTLTWHKNKRNGALFPVVEQGDRIVIQHETNATENPTITITGAVSFTDPIYSATATMDGSISAGDVRSLVEGKGDPGAGSTIEVENADGSVVLTGITKIKFTNAGDVITQNGSVAEIQTAGSGGGGTPATPDFDVLWEMDDLTDSIGSLDLTMTGVVDFNAGKFGNAAYINSNGEYLTAPINSAVDFGNRDFSVLFWLYLDNISNNYAIAGKDATNKRFFSIVSVGSELRINLGDGPNLLTPNMAATLSAGTWTHVAFTHNATNNQVVLYIDGTQVDTETLSGTPTDDGTTALYFGELESTVGNDAIFANMQGRLDRFGIISAVLTQAQVQDFANATS